MPHPEYIGKTVHFVNHKGKCRPGFILRLPFEDSMTVHLSVLLDGADTPRGELIERREGVLYSGERKAGTWHWPEHQ
jgi:hypothetical protein